MAYTFFAAQGKTTGTSLLEPDYIDYAKKMLDEAGDKLLLPVDTVVAKNLQTTPESKLLKVTFLTAGWVLTSVLRQSNFTKNALKDAKTVVWNGPMGVFEMPNFAKVQIQ